MITSCDAEKPFDKNKRPFMIKSHKMGMEGTYLNINKAIYGKVKVKVAQLCPISRLEYWSVMPSSRVSASQESNPYLLHLLHCKQILYLLSYLGSPKNRFSSM
ncbi:hypothetical protein ACXWQN_09325, partial [Streptococcus pyogenes]